VLRRSNKTIAIIISEIGTGNIVLVLRNFIKNKPAIIQNVAAPVTIKKTDVI
jgi:hypothetical protein